MITNQTMKSSVNITIKCNIDQKHLLTYFQAKTGSQPKKKVLSKSVEYFCDDMRAKTVSQPYKQVLSKSTEYLHDDKGAKTVSQSNFRFDSCPSLQSQLKGRGHPVKTKLKSVS